MSIDEIYSRRSIRKFKKKEVEREHICEIIKAGIAAPSAKNRQPWKYIVFTGDKKDELLNAMENGLENEKEKNNMTFGLMDAFNTLRIMKEAPVIIVTLNTKGTSPYVPIEKKCTHCGNMRPAVHRCVYRKYAPCGAVAWTGNSLDSKHLFCIQRADRISGN